jgi:hypothetical protein
MLPDYGGVYEKIRVRSIKNNGGLVSADVILTVLWFFTVIFMVKVQNTVKITVIFYR